MGSLLLAAGAPGKRFCLPHASVMIHQPLGGFRGPAADIEIQATEILKWRDRLDRIYAKHTGQDLAVIVANRDRDKFFDATEAKEFGLIDEVVVERAVVTT
jgi:ATP-dependent Clp protease protease subunit